MPRRRFFWVALASILVGCQLVRYSPFVADDKGQGDQTVAAVSTQSKVGADSQYRFAVIADPQKNFDELQKLVGYLNARPDIQFLLVAGDFVHYGLQQEFQWFRGIMKSLRMPYFVVIGNHEALANGPIIYNNLFGPTDFTFDVGPDQFILFNNNEWEFPGNVPDFNWLENSLLAASNKRYRFVVSHVAPQSLQLSEESAKRFESILLRGKASLSVHGHEHGWKERLSGGYKVHTLVVDDGGDGGLAVVTVASETISIEKDNVPVK